NVENVLINLEHANPEKIRLIHHGIDMSDYLPGSVKEDRVSAVKLKYNIKSDDGPVVGAISRFIELKGLQYLIPAFKKLLLSYPKAVLVLANASGSYSPEIAKLLTGLDERNYRLIVFENDIAALYKVFDCFVHIPITNSVEAFGQIYLEALASKVPSVFTMSGVAPEFIIDKVNGMVVPFKDSEAVYNALLFILRNKGNLETMLNNGYEIVKEKFDIRFKIEKLENLYSS
ncbi:MAG TPA: glycosyltransferase family 4 protein, partial [Bacteroidia bacterium]|nr:glycosyltransferase family 4 protein [Bacteroidia bacterium]